MCAFMHMLWRSNVDVKCLNCSLPCMLNQACHLNPEIATWTGLASHFALGTFVSAPEVLGLQMVHRTHPVFTQVLRIQTHVFSSLHSTTSAFPTKPSAQPLAALTGLLSSTITTAVALHTPLPGKPGSVCHCCMPFPGKM